ncbi:MAG: ISNCY family transposase, partial [Desulfobacterales bacterium]|nr:ISNCY family transposase [Desulfobacterales bacterium]
MALQDLTHNVNNPGTGANGMTAEQVVRAAIIKQMGEYSYEDLAFHIVDSICYRKFCRIGIADKGFKKSALCSNIKALSPGTWEAINRVIVADAKDKDIEKGREVRIDCTVVSSNIHKPLDSSLLWDSVRVIIGILVQAKALFDDLDIRVTDHTKRAKRRMLGIMNAKNKKSRKKLYIDLLKVAYKTIGYAQTAVPLLAEYVCSDPIDMIKARSMAEDLKKYIELTYQVIDQTERRVIHGESVPASEKIVSIFEPHTDIIVKDRRETFYGHKICLTGGSSNLIVDCVIVEGNPADSTLTDQMIDRQKDIYGRYPLKVALDGGFASKENLESAKGKGVKDVCFAKKRGLAVEDMCRSEWVYKRLRRFRAGVESGISWLKRCFGLSTCIWKGLRSFKSYVWASIVSANLLTLARKEMA